MKFVKNKTAASAPKAPPIPKAGRKTTPAKARKARGKPKFILLIGDEGAILVYMQGATVVRRLFAASPQPDHTSAVMDLMNTNPRVPLYVLADVIDQQYVRHSFPPVSSLSVNNLVKRRIDRDFQAEDITGFLKLGRETGGRKEWQFLLIALGNTPLIQQWVDLLVEMPNELKGIFLSPVEAQVYIPQLHNAITAEKPLPWQLLVSHHKVSGFRQIVLKGGKLVFTRVTQAIDDSIPAVIAGNIEQEIINTLEYLKRLGFPENNSIEMIVVASADVKETLDLGRFKAGQAHVLTPLDIAEALKLEQAALSADRFGDVVMAAAFARAKKHHLKLLTAYGQKLAQIYMGRVALKGLAALAAVALLGMIAMNILAVFNARSAVSDSEDKRRPIQTELESVRKALGSLNKDVTFKSAVMLTYDAYMKDLVTPTEFIKELAPNLTPETRVRKFSWGAPGASATANAAAPTTSSTGTTAAPTAVVMPVPGQPLEMRLELDIVGQFTNSKELAAFVENFVARLQKNLTRYDVTHLPYPWEGNTPTNLEISFDQPTAEPEGGLKEGENKITLIFAGPKAGTGSAGTAAPAQPPLPGATP